MKLSVFSDEYYMQQALNEALLAEENDEVPVGAVIVCLITAVPVIRILVHKMFLELLSFIANLLSLHHEMRLMTEISSFLGYTGAIMAISSVFFLLSLSMMASM